MGPAGRGELGGRLGTSAVARPFAQWVGRCLHLAVLERGFRSCAYVKVHWRKRLSDRDSEARAWLTQWRSSLEVKWLTRSPHFSQLWSNKARQTIKDCPELAAALEELTRQIGSLVVMLRLPVVWRPNWAVAMATAGRCRSSGRWP